MGRLLLLAIVLSCAVNSVATGRAKTVAGSPLHRNAPATYARLLILRPQVKFWKEQAFSRSESEGAAEAAQAGLHKVLFRIFADKGCTSPLDVDATSLWEEASPNDEAVKALQADYDALLATTNGQPYTPDDNKTSRAALRGDLSKAQGNVDFDAVVLTRAEGHEMTKSARVNLYTAGDAKFSLDFSLGIVDKSTGELSYFCRSTATGNFLGAPDSRLADPVRECLKEYFRAARKHR